VKAHTYRFGWLLGAALGLTGCSSVGDTVGGWFGGSSDGTREPAELTKIDNAFTPTQRWSLRIGNGTDEAVMQLRPALAQGRIVVAAEDGTIAAVDASGTLLWQVRAEQTVTTGPGASKDLVTVATADGKLLALEASDGKLRWKADLSSIALAPALVTDSMVVVRTLDGRTQALSVQDGTRRWIDDRSVPVLSVHGYGSPVLDQDQVLLGLDNGRVVALGLEDGRERWNHTVAPARGRTEVERMVDVDAMPQVFGDVVHAVSYQGNLALLRRDSGESLWKREFSSLAGIDVVGNLLVAVDTESQVFAFARDTGTALWKQDALLHRALSRPQIVGRSLVVADFEGWVHWLDLQDGSIQARVRAADGALAAEPVQFGDSLVLYGHKGTLQALRAR
jgi:outer membrane protein assembly factor BamB